MEPTPSTPTPSEQPGTTAPVAESRLADLLWNRYGGAPGVIAPPLARYLLQRADRFRRNPLPLLTMLQRRLAETNLLPTPTVFPDAILPPAEPTAEASVTESPASVVSKQLMRPTVTPDIVSTATATGLPTVAPPPSAALTNRDRGTVDAGPENQRTPPAATSRQSQAMPNQPVVRAYRATTEPVPSSTHPTIQSPGRPDTSPVSTVVARGIVTETAPPSAPLPGRDRDMVAMRAATAGAADGEDITMKARPVSAATRGQAAIPVVTAQMARPTSTTRVTASPQAIRGQERGTAIQQRHEIGPGGPLIQRNATTTDATDYADATDKVAITVTAALEQSVGTPLAFTPPSATQPPVTLVQTAQPLLQRLLGPPPAVRLHTDAKAANAAAALGADAFTTGRDIFFAAGQADLTQPQGVALLTHELTHVVQQQQAADNSALWQAQRLEQTALANEQIIQRALTPAGVAVPMAALPVAAPMGPSPTPQPGLPPRAPAMPRSAGSPPGYTPPLALPLVQTATVQREAATSLAAPAVDLTSGAATSAALPTVTANAGAGEPPGAPPVDVAQLADQVYGLLTRRLADERARRGF